jgi:hypothetical protein
MCVRAEALSYIHTQLQTVAFMEPLYWQRREGTRRAASSPHAQPCPFANPDTLRVLHPPPAADLESRRVDTTNASYKGGARDLSYPAPGCGAGRWDGIPPGHKAQPVDLDVAAPALQKLGLPPTWEGACVLAYCMRVCVHCRANDGSLCAHPSLRAAGYACVFGSVYVGSPLARGALWRAACARAEVEEARYQVALAAALH